MNRSAHRTLRLRAFLHKFGREFPPEYYGFLNEEASAEPDWGRLYPARWAAAGDETQRLELGTRRASLVLHERIARIRKEHGGRTVLIGGPPCQSYSVIGRARNAGNSRYDADADGRQLLYREYVKVFQKLQPVVAVLENVRGLLSSRTDGKPIFPDLLARLERPASSVRYRLFALTPRSGADSRGEPWMPEDFLVNAEVHGVPQTRHRVFVVCVRNDVADAFPRRAPQLDGRSEEVPLGAIIGAMPRLRSRLSPRDDADRWTETVIEACDLIRANAPAMSGREATRFRQAIARARRSVGRSALPVGRAPGDTDLPAACPRDLRSWLTDGRLRTLPNNETRGHMRTDLARYLFAAVFADTFRRSPRTFDFPEALAARHANWHTGNFSDRYRVQLSDRPCTTITSHVSRDGHYFIHPDPGQCRSLTVREVARLQTFPDNYFFHGPRTQQYVQVGNAVPPFLAHQIALTLSMVLDRHDHAAAPHGRVAGSPFEPPAATTRQSNRIAV